MLYLFSPRRLSIGNFMQLKKGFDQNPNNIDNIINKLNQQIQSLKNVLLASEDQIAIYDQKHRFLYANKAFEMITGVSTEKLIGKTSAQIKLPNVFKIGRKLTRVLKTGRQFTGELKYKKHIFEYVLTPILNSNSSSSIILGTFRDLTKRVQVEKEFKYAKTQMEVILKNLADGIVVFNTKGDIVYFNDSVWKIIFLHSSEDFLKMKNIRNIIKYLAKDLDATSEQSKPISINDSPTLRVLRGEFEPQAIFQIFSSKENEKRYISIKSRPVIEDEGNFNLIVSIIEDITQQKELEERKDEFINVLSHELKTPLTSIKAFAQILERKFRSSSDLHAQRLLSQINFQVDHFSKLVNQLLDTTQLYSNNLTLYKNAFKFNDLVKETVSEISKIDTCHNYIVNYRADVNIVADRNRIGQVLTNILSNAARYSPQNAKVLIKISAKDNSLVVSIKDFGIGIPQYEQNKIFDRFYQIRKTIYHHDPHLGLGLYISSQIIKSHGGIIKIKSQESKGSVFYFTLPIQ